MSPWNRLSSLLGLKRGSGPRYFALDETSHVALANIADQEKRPEEEIHAELLSAALTQRDSYINSWRRWEFLSPREKDVTALTCLGYTNRQIAAKLNLSPDTVKGYVRQVLMKFHLHSKDGLRMLLGNWDFSDWERKPPY